MTTEEKARLLDWLITKTSGEQIVRPDGSREPQIRWSFSIDRLCFFYGTTPLEALQNAYNKETQGDAP